MIALLLVMEALAAPLMLRIADPEAQLQGAVEGVVEGDGVTARFTPKDDGAPPDVVADDGIRAVVVQAPDAARLQITLTDSRGEVFTGAVTLTPGAQMDLDVRITGDGAVEAYTPLGPSGAASGSTPRGSPQMEGAEGRTLPWAVAAVGWLLAIGLLRRRDRRGGTSPVPGLAPARVGPTVYREPEPAERLLVALGAAHRVLVVGPLPDVEVGEGSTFHLGPSPVALGEVQARVDALRGRGRPVAVLLTGRVEALEGPIEPEALARAINAPVVVPGSG
ncbi:MAG: hypothetical protein H6739_16695 [Alphaproteobacteria bacterium]|nr:hypothetical protein [Alphaproteobacteria bacterium]